MRDISWYMHALEHRFTTWFNATRPTRRRGTLWAGRFTNVVLGNAEAVWRCLNYVELNPVRAKMVNDPADYRFCSFGAWTGTGRHPFAHNVQEVLLPWLSGQYGIRTLKDLYKVLRGAFAEITGRSDIPQNDMTKFCIGVNHRVRYWVDGLVIGSEAFIEENFSDAEGVAKKIEERKEAKE